RAGPPGLNSHRAGAAASFNWVLCGVPLPWLAEVLRTRALRIEPSSFDRPLPARKAEELYWNGKQAAEDPANETTPFLLDAANLVYDPGYPHPVIRHLLTRFEGWGDPQERVRKTAEIMRDIVGNPFRATAIQAEWLTPTAVAIARQIYDSRDFS